MSDINIKKIAKLSKIRIEDCQKEKLSNQLEKIINWIDTLSQANTDNVQILNNIHAKNLTLFEDNIESRETAEDVMTSATNDKYNYYTVPKMIK